MHWVDLMGYWPDLSYRATSDERKYILIPASRLCPMRAVLWSHAGKRASAFSSVYRGEILPAAQKTLRRRCSASNTLASVIIVASSSCGVSILQGSCSFPRQGDRRCLAAPRTKRAGGCFPKWSVAPSWNLIAAAGFPVLCNIFKNNSSTGSFSINPDQTSNRLNRLRFARLF